MIEVVQGNFFDYDAEIRVNTVNCVGVMGAGVALQFKNKFPKMYEEYVKECGLGKVRIGKPHVWIDSGFFNSSPIIINFPTKNDWKKPSEYDYVEKGLLWLRDYLQEKGNVRITLPALGCGHGGLDWSIVKKMIFDYLQGLEAQIFVFEPASSVDTNLDSEDLNALSNLGIVKLMPNDVNYPARLIGKSATNIYLNGDITAFQNKLLSIIIDTKATEREKTAVLDCIDNLPDGDFSFLLSYNSSFEIDLVKTLLSRRNKIIVIIPYGILNLKLRKDLIPLWSRDQITVVSISKPKQSWSRYESINSLKFRIKTADLILITNFETSPLTKFERELKESKVPLFFINYWSEKNDLYERLNAFSIGKDKETQRPNLSLLHNALFKNNNTK